MNQSEYKDSDFCILTFFRAGEVRSISCYSRYSRKPQWTGGNGTFTYNVPVTYCYIQTPPNLCCFVFYLKKKKNQNTWFIISYGFVGWPGGSSATLLTSFWWLPSAWGSAGRPKMGDGTSCQLGHFRSSRGFFSSVDSMIGFLTWESQGCPPAGKRKKSQGLLGSRYLNSLITSATSPQSHRPAHIQSSRKIDISRWVKQQRHVIKMLAFWK